MSGFQKKGKLAHKANGPLTTLEASLTVADLIDVFGTWSLDKVRHILPDDLCDCISYLPPPNPDGFEDRIA